MAAAPTGVAGPEAAAVPVRYWFLAALSVGAGAIHLAMAPAHAASSTLEALGFGLMGWVQIGLGIALVARPSRAVLGGTALVQLVAIAAWVVSRTAGLPFGEEAGVAEAIGTVDALTATFEATLLAGVVLALAWESGPARRIPEVVSVIGGIAVLAAATAALAAPGAVHDHGHGDELAAGHDHGAADGEDAHDHGAASDDHGDHADGDDHGDDHGAELASADGHGHSPSSTATGHGGHDDGSADHGDHGDGSADHGDHDDGSADHGDHGDGSTDHAGHGDTTTGDGHDHGSVLPPVTIDYGPADRCDLGFNPNAYYRDATIAGVDFINGPTEEELNAPHIMSEVQAAILVQNLAAKTDQEYFDFLAGHGHSGSGDTHDGHLAPSPWKAMTDPAQCAQLAQELTIARATALKYPTAADAVAAGYHQVTPFIPGIAGHYIKDSLVDGTWEVDKPEMILYDGNELDAHVIGLSYEIRHDGPTEPAVGFTGRNDHYHRHDRLCFKNGVTIGDSSMTDEQCAALGGEVIDGSKLWMSHAWVVPGCESPWGIFSGINPLLVFDLDGGPGCATASVKSRYDLRPPVPPPAPYTAAAVPPLWLVPPTVAALARRRRRR